LTGCYPFFLIKKSRARNIRDTTIPTERVIGSWRNT
jgi:hypothetical protein